MSSGNYKVIFFCLLFIIVCPISYAAFQGSNKFNGSVAPPAGDGVYYQVQPDMRRCPTPSCGGYWISAVNQEDTPCTRTSYQAECYVAEIKWGAIGLNGSEGATLVLGHLIRKTSSGFGSLNVLVPAGAWRPASEAPPLGTWYGLRDNGRRCITSPCYSTDERMLNRKGGKQTISGVDLNAVGVTVAELKAARIALDQNELIATGKNEVMIDEGPAGDGITMVASQFFLRIGQQQGTELSCKTKSDCTLSVYHSFVNSPDECYCPTCPAPIDVKSAEANEKSWHQHCSDFGFSISGNKAVLLCPQVLCVAPDPVGCVDNQCTFSGDSPLLDGIDWLPMGRNSFLEITDN